MFFLTINCSQRLKIVPFYILLASVALEECIIESAGSSLDYNLESVCILSIFYTCLYLIFSMCVCVSLNMLHCRRDM